MGVTNDWEAMNVTLQLDYFCFNKSAYKQTLFSIIHLGLRIFTDYKPQ